MLENLLKAKRTDNGEWVYWNIFGELCRESGKRTRLAIQKGATTSYYDYIHQIITLIDKNTVCRPTGIPDKNGKKIWENDEVRVKYTNGQEDDEDTAYVKNTKHGFVPWSWEYECDGCDLRCELMEIEVIGNVFDNAELLKE